MASGYIFLTLLGFAFLTYFIPKMETPTYRVPTPDIQMFTKWNFFIYLNTTVSFSIFAVFGAIMHAKISVVEYTGKRSILLLSYPQSRKRILCVKCGLVFFFTVVMMLLCTLSSLGIFATVSNLFHLMPKPFTQLDFSLLVKTATISSLLAASVGLIALRIGLWKGSLIATVVTSVILIMPFGNIITLFPDKAFFIFLIAFGIIFAIAMLLLAGILAKVNRMEAL